MKVAPKVRIALLVWAGYLAIILVVTLLGGVPYTELASSTGNLLLAGVLPLAVGTAYLVIVASVLGWWQPALREKERSHHKWPIIAPLFMALAVVLAASSTNWLGLELDFLLAALALGIIVGFNEEFLTRGLVIVGLRGRLREVWVMLISAGLFGLMHGLNFFLGQEISSTLLQMASTFAGGCAFYIVRRVTGSLIWAMILHGSFDFASILSRTSTGLQDLRDLAGFADTLCSLLALIFVAFVIKGAHSAHQKRTALVQ